MDNDVFEQIVGAVDGMSAERRERVKELATGLVILLGALIDEADRRG